MNLNSETHFRKGISSPKIDLFDHSYVVAEGKIKQANLRFLKVCNFSEEDAFESSLSTLVKCFYQGSC